MYKQFKIKTNHPDFNGFTYITYTVIRRNGVLYWYWRSGLKDGGCEPIPDIPIHEEIVDPPDVIFFLPYEDYPL